MSAVLVAEERPRYEAAESSRGDEAQRDLRNGPPAATAAMSPPDVTPHGDDDVMTTTATDRRPDRQGAGSTRVARVWTSGVGTGRVVTPSWDDDVMSAVLVAEERPRYEAADSSRGDRAVDGAASGVGGVDGVDVGGGDDGVAVDGVAVEVDERAVRERIERDLMVLGRQTLGGAVSDAALLGSVEWLAGVVNRVEGEKLRRIAELQRREAAPGLGARSLPDLLEERLGVTRSQARSVTQTAEVLEDLPQTADRLRSGQIGVAQAATAANTLVEMGACDPDTTAAFDAFAATEAAAGKPAARLKESLDAFASTVGSDHLAQREQRAVRNRRLRRWTDQTSGMRRFDIALPPVMGAIVDAAVDAFIRADHTTTAGGAGEDGRGSTAGVEAGVEGDPRTFEQRAADALVAVASQAIDTADVPAGPLGQAQVLLIGTDDALDGVPGAAPAQVDGVGAVSTQTAQQILCDAEVTRVTMTRNGAVLDAGRTRRDPTPAQRAAVIARDRACVGCGAPVSRCQIHHVKWFVRDRGGTDESNLVLLCYRCHHHVHHHGWTVTGDHIRGFAIDRTPTGPRLPDHHSRHRP